MQGKVKSSYASAIGADLKFPSDKSVPFILIEKTNLQSLSDSLCILQEHHVYLMAVCMVLELVGAVFFIFDWTLGALMLLAYTLLVTPIFHDFWNSKDESVRGMEVIMFFKVGTGLWPHRLSWPIGCCGTASHRWPNLSCLKTAALPDWQSYHTMQVHHLHNVCAGHGQSVLKQSVLASECGTSWCVALLPWRSQSQKPAEPQAGLRIDVSVHGKDAALTDPQSTDFASLYA